jgi:hypothetical protein
VGAPKTQVNPQTQMKAKKSPAQKTPSKAVATAASVLSKFLPPPPPPPLQQR